MLDSDNKGKSCRPPTSRPSYKLSVELLQTYKRINEIFYEEKRKKGPKRGLHNNGYDDENGNYICETGEEINGRYIVQQYIGKGSFGVVVKAMDHCKDEKVAIKIIKNKIQFLNQAKVEIDILTKLNSSAGEEHNVVTLKRVFTWKEHLCLVFELLAENLYDLLRQTQFHGVPLGTIKKFGYQLLRTLEFVSQPNVGVIHCDLKPENILLKHSKRSAIKVIDFGSSCYVTKRMFKYIQSRFYRAPEVIFGLPYDCAIDMWSLACILVEMHTGRPLFDGRDEAEQMCKFTAVLDTPPQKMIDQSPKRKNFFVWDQKAKKWSLGPPNKDLAKFPKRDLEDILGVYTGGPGGRRKDMAGHTEADYLQFVDLLQKMLVFSPKDRLTPADALQHPFLASIVNSINKHNQQTHATETALKCIPMSPSTPTYNRSRSRDHHRQTSEHRSHSHGSTHGHHRTTDPHYATTPTHSMTAVSLTGGGNSTPLSGTAGGHHTPNMTAGSHTTTDVPTTEVVYSREGTPSQVHLHHSLSGTNHHHAAHQTSATVSHQPRLHHSHSINSICTPTHSNHRSSSIGRERRYSASSLNTTSSHHSHHSHSRHHSSSNGNPPPASSPSHQTLYTTSSMPALRHSSNSTSYLHPTSPRTTHKPRHSSMERSHSSPSACSASSGGAHQHTSHYVRGGGRMDTSAASTTATTPSTPSYHNGQHTSQRHYSATSPLSPHHHHPHAQQSPRAPRSTSSHSHLHMAPRSASSHSHLHLHAPQTTNTNQQTTESLFGDIPPLHLSSDPPMGTGRKYMQDYTAFPSPKHGSSQSTVDVNKYATLGSPTTPTTGAADHRYTSPLAYSSPSHAHHDLGGLGGLVSPKSPSTSRMPADVPW